MQKRAFLPVVVGAGFWCVLGAAFLCISAPRVLDAVKLGKFGPIHPDHTTDNYLAALTNVRSGSQQLLTVIETLSPEKPVAILLPRYDAESTFLGAIVTYLSWPREIEARPVTGGRVDLELRTLRPQELSALVFCGMEPPAWIEYGFRIGSDVAITRLAPVIEERN